MTYEEKLGIILKTLDSKKAEGLQAIKIRDLTVIADYFVIASGNSSTQTRTLAEEVEYQMSQAGVEPTRKEGYNGSNWVILDYSDVVVHVFYKETRDYYQLERLWSDGERIDIEKYVTGE
ncbi:MAG: ribosome silencing factor [Ruminococcus sp.]|nr:ribosome silencing factor [Ruminococcus sp.]